MKLLIILICGCVAGCAMTPEQAARLQAMGAAMQGASAGLQQSYPAAGGGVCFKTTEYTSGFNKVCNYNCTGSAAAITIGSTGICPLSIQR